MILNRTSLKRQLEIYSILVKNVFNSGWLYLFFDGYSSISFTDFYELVFEFLLFDYQLFDFIEYYKSKCQKKKRSPFKQQILALHDLHKKWSSSDIADELQNRIDGKRRKGKYRKVKMSKKKLENIEKENVDT